MATKKSTPSQVSKPKSRFKNQPVPINYQITAQGEMALNVGWATGLLKPYKKSVRQRLMKLLEIYDHIEEGHARRPESRRRDLRVLHRLGFIRQRKKPIEIYDDIGPLQL